jgi:hypothetical protein
MLKAHIQEYMTNATELGKTIATHDIFVYIEEGKLGPNAEPNRHAEGPV